jgi:hypothetical protein
MLVLQLLSMAAMMVTRRLAFICYAMLCIISSSAPQKLMREFTQSEISPALLTSRIMSAKSAAADLGAASSVYFAMIRRLKLPYSPLILKQQAADAIAKYFTSMGLPILPESTNLHKLEGLGQAPPPLLDGYYVAKWLMHHRGNSRWSRY